MGEDSLVQPPADPTKGSLAQMRKNLELAHSLMEQAQPNAAVQDSLAQDPEKKKKKKKKEEEEDEDSLAQDPDEKKKKKKKKEEEDEDSLAQQPQASVLEMDNPDDALAEDPE